jgi:hypothetical protein
LGGEGECAELNRKDLNRQPAADKTRANIYLLAVTGIYSAGTLVGTVMAGHGWIGLSLEAVALIALVGPFISLSAIALAVEQKKFSLPILALASLAIWSVSLWTFWKVLEGYGNV